MAKTKTRADIVSGGPMTPPAVTMPPPLPMDRAAGPQAPAPPPTREQIEAEKARNAEDLRRRAEALAVTELSVPLTLCDMRELFPQDPNRPEAPYACDRIDVNLSPQEARTLRMIYDGLQREGRNLRSQQEALKILLHTVHTAYVKQKA